MSKPIFEAGDLKAFLEFRFGPQPDLVVEVISEFIDAKLTSLGIDAELLSQAKDMPEKLKKLQAQADKNSEEWKFLNDAYAEFQRCQVRLAAFEARETVGAELIAALDAEDPLSEIHHLREVEQQLGRTAKANSDLRIRLAELEKDFADAVKAEQYYKGVVAELEKQTATSVS